MALNLSRNTKVFVSSVNGLPTAGGQFLTGYISAGGSNYAVGDRINFSGASAGANFKGIVETVSSGAVTKLNINGNGIGNGIADSEAMTEATAYTTAGVASSGSGCIVECVTSGTATSPVTTEGSRTATGRFVGNGSGANTFRIGVLDGYSFSQGSESTDVTISEAGATPSRGSKRFNDSLPPAEWSFGTYVRPFIHGADSWRAVNSYDMCENILWNALAGTAVTGASGAAVACEANATAASITTGGNVVFTNSNAHELLKLNLYFVLENTTYRLNDAQIGTAEIDFSIDGIAQITWSGSATTIDQVSTANEDPSKYLSVVTGSDASAQTTGNTDTYTESYTFADSTGPSDADYLRNKLSALYLDTNAQGGGSGSQGLDARTYDINITGGSITIENNVTYVTPETIGVVDKPIGSFTGARTISGSLTMYLDTKSDGSNQLLSDLAGATDLVSNSFDMSLLMGTSYASSRPGADRADNAHAAADFTGPAVEFFMPKCHLSVPAIEVGDLIAVSVEFSAQGSTMLTTDEMSVKYMGITSHTDTRGYDHNGTANINVVAAA
tara:strand:- start:375 stop:2048 length:1674 start_codon:yes stop_codon:yes gene_type:complete